MLQPVGPLYWPCVRHGRDDGVLRTVGTGNVMFAACVVDSTGMLHAQRFLRPSINVQRYGLLEEASRLFQAPKGPIDESCKRDSKLPQGIPQR